MAEIDPKYISGRYIDSNGVLWIFHSQATSVSIAPLGPGFGPAAVNSLFAEVTGESAKRYDPPMTFQTELQIGDRGISKADGQKSLINLIEQYAKAHPGDVRGPEAEEGGGGGWLVLLALAYAALRRKRR